MRILFSALLLTTALFGQEEERVIVPQFASGGGWKTRLVLINRSLSLTSRPKIAFYNQAGYLLFMPIIGSGTVSNLERTIPPGRSTIIESEGGSGPLVASWAEIRTGGRVAALCLWFNPSGPFSAIPSAALTQ